MHFSPHLRPKTFDDLNITGLLPYSCFGQETFGIQSELNLSSSLSSLQIWNLTSRTAQVLVQKKSRRIQILFMQEVTKKQNKNSYQKLSAPFKLRVPTTRIFFFWRKYLAYHIYKAILIEEKFQKAQNTVFLGPKVLLFCLKSVPWTGNKSAGDDAENCENSQLTLTVSKLYREL